MEDFKKNAHYFYNTIGTPRILMENKYESEKEVVLLAGAFWDEHTELIQKLAGPQGLVALWEKWGRLVYIIRGESELDDWEVFDKKEDATDEDD